VADRRWLLLLPRKLVRAHFFFSFLPGWIRNLGCSAPVSPVLWELLWKLRGSASILFVLKPDQFIMNHSIFFRRNHLCTVYKVLSFNIQINRPGKATLTASIYDQELPLFSSWNIDGIMDVHVHLAPTP
jgi:hypothetical protein